MTVPNYYTFDAYYPLNDMMISWLKKAPHRMFTSNRGLPQSISQQGHSSNFSSMANTNDTQDMLTLSQWPLHGVAHQWHILHDEMWTLCLDWLTPFIGQSFFIDSFLLSLWSNLLSPLHGYTLPFPSSGYVLRHMASYPTNAQPQHTSAHRTREKGSPPPQNPWTWIRSLKTNKLISW